MTDQQGLTDVEDGAVVSYDPGRGFGFLRPDSGGADVFVHANAIRGGGRLRAGQRVRFRWRDDARGPRATWVEPGARGRFDLAPGAAAGAWLVVGLAAATLGLRLGLDLPWPVAWLAAVNPTAIGAFTLDKHRAVRQGRRVPEAVLHALALAGGSPGALLAIALLRHKSRKRSFLYATAAIVVLQLTALAAWFAAR